MNLAMMVLEIFAPLSKMTGLPPSVLICALVIIIFLIIFGILILVKVRNIIKVLNKVNYSLDNIVQRIEKRSAQVENKKSVGKRGASATNTDREIKDTGYPRHNPRKLATDLYAKSKAGKKSANQSADNQKHIEAKSPGGDPKPVKSEGFKTNQEISEKICELLKKSGRPTLYQDLAKLLSKDFPGYDYDYFLKEVERLQKEGKVKAQLVAGKLYFQIKEP